MSEQAEPRDRAKALQDCTIDELMGEFHDRVLAYVVAASVPDDNQTCQTQVWSGGNRVMRAGLCIMASRQIDKVLDAMEDEDPDGGEEGNPE